MGTFSVRLQVGDPSGHRFGRTWIRIDGMADVSPVVFRDEESLPLLGAVTLEILGLGIDPVNRRLIPLDVSLLPRTGVTEGQV